MPGHAHPPAQPWPCPGPTRRRAWCHPAESSCSGSDQSQSLAVSLQVSRGRNDVLISTGSAGLWKSTSRGRKDQHSRARDLVSWGQENGSVDQLGSWGLLQVSTEALDFPVLGF